MSKKPQKFRKTDVTRAVAAVEAAGHKVARVEFDIEGKFSVVTASEAEGPPEHALDEWIARNAHPS